jgi:hypothetical protein
VAIVRRADGDSVSAIQFPTIRDALHSWFVQGSGLDNAHVIWSGQLDANGNTMPRPSGQYISLRLTVLLVKGSDWSDYDLTGGVFTQYVRGPRTAILTAQCFQGLPTGGKEIDTTMCALRLHDAYVASYLDPINDALVAAGVGISGISAIQTTDHVISHARNESRAIMTATLQLASEMTYSYPAGTGWIQFVNGDGIAGTDAANCHVRVVS